MGGESILRAVERWLAVQAEHRPDHEITPADMRSSALLERLLNGGDPLPQPPPLTFGHPWYELIERHGVPRCEVHGPFNDAGYADPAGERLWVNRDTNWRVLAVEAEGVMLVQYRDRQTRYRVTRLAMPSLPWNWRIDRVAG